MTTQAPDPRLAEIEQLLADVRANRAGAWSRFVERYERLVWAVPRRMGFSEADSADIAQATWLLVWRHLEHVRSPQGLGSWLITTTAREAARFRRRGKRREEHEEFYGQADEESPVLPLEEAQRLEQIQLVRDSITALETRCRELLRETELEGSSYQEAAARLGMPIGSVGPTRLRCLAKLMTQLQERGLS